MVSLEHERRFNLFISIDLEKPYSNLAKYMSQRSIQGQLTGRQIAYKEEYIFHCFWEKVLNASKQTHLLLGLECSMTKTIQPFAYIFAS